jgi:thioredoxin 1
MKTLYILLAAILLGGVAWLFISGGANNDTSELTELDIVQEQVESDANMEQLEDIVEEEAKADASGDEPTVNLPEPEPAPAVAQVGTYGPYSPDMLTLADSGDVVLFFSAAWCPTCRGLDADINANLDAIPSGVAILKVDYDKSTALKQKYGVTYQHTLVQVGSDGSQIKKWSGSPTLSDLVSKVQ